jgi:signal peptidase II
VKLTPARRNDAIMVAVALAVIAADQLTKHWIVDYFRAPGVRGPIPILGRVLELIYTQNTGVAFSLLEGQTLLFLFIGVAVVAIGALYWRMRDTGNLALKATFGLILGGAIGNLIDRFAHTYVVDFIHFQIPGHFDYPVFNVADSAISIGVVVLAYLLWRGLPQDGASARQDAAREAAQKGAAAGQSPVAPADSTADGRPGPASPGPAPRVRNPRARAK